MARSAPQIDQVLERTQVECGGHVRRADLAEAVHAHQELAQRLLRAIEMRKQRAVPAVGLLPAVRSFADGVFEIAPHAPHDVVGIVDIARQPIGAVAAQVGGCIRGIRVIGPFLSQNLRPTQASSSRSSASAFAFKRPAKAAADWGRSASASNTPSETASNIVFDRRNANNRAKDVFRIGLRRLIVHRVLFRQIGARGEQADLNPARTRVLVDVDPHFQHADFHGRQPRKKLDGDPLGLCVDRLDLPHEAADFFLKPLHDVVQLDFDLVLQLEAGRSLPTRVGRRDTARRTASIPARIMSISRMIRAVAPPVRLARRRRWQTGTGSGVLFRVAHGRSPVWSVPGIGDQPLTANVIKSVAAPYRMNFVRSSLAVIASSLSSDVVGVDRNRLLRRRRARRSSRPRAAAPTACTGGGRRCFGWFG